MNSIQHFLIAAGLVVMLFLVYGSFRNPDFWSTADQRGDRLVAKERFAEAAETYRDPLRAGTAWFRAKDFERAETEFMKSTRPEAHFNRGYALIMQGKYETAVEAYDAALAQRPDWPEAVINREVAALNAAKLKKEGGDMTGGKLEADDFVFHKGKNNDKGAEDDTTGGGEELSDAALQAMWLRRVQTKPADFLRSKFAFQAQQGGRP